VEIKKMVKRKVYLDTSVISSYFDEKCPERIVSLVNLSLGYSCPRCLNIIIDANNKNGNVIIF
jgi:hypothetical protein